MSLTNSQPVEVAESAARSARSLAGLPTEARNAGLTAIHEALSSKKDLILEANARDLAAASKAVDGQISQSLLKRLDLGKPGKFDDMLNGILDVRGLDDPVGCVTLRTRLDDGLELERATCPIGVLLIIFESRPEVIANITALAIKSGNAAILKGGKESTESFVTISTIISEALEKTQIPKDAIQLVTTRDVIPELLSLDRHIDLVIPRGSNDLVRYVKNNTRIPVLGHADGLCCVYIHHDADQDMAVKILLDAKLGYPAACNAVETLLVHQDVLSTTLVAVAEALTAKGVNLRCDEPSLSSLRSSLPAERQSLLQPATDADYDTEFLDLVLAVKTIPSSAQSPSAASQSPSSSSSSSDFTSVDVAIEHINVHSSHHTDAILTASGATAKRFQSNVDSAGVYWNTSTRMADGLRYGFGTEVGISTNKIHARGPVGLEGLMIYKYLVHGTGQVAGDYHAGPQGRKWKHESLPI